MFEQVTDLSGIQELADWRVLVYVLVSLLVLLVAKLMYSVTAGFKLKEQLIDHDNKAVGIAFAGYMFSVCIVITGVLFSPSSVMLEGEPGAKWLLDLGGTVLWSLIGCVMLILAQWINDKAIFRSFCNRKEMVQDENMGLGTALAGTYLATALVVRSAMSGEGVGNFWQDLLITLIWFAVTQALLILFSFVYQRVTKFDLHHEVERDNPAAGIAFGGGILAFTILLSFYIQRYDGLLGLLIWALVSAVILILARALTNRLILPGKRLDAEICEDKNWGAALIEFGISLGVAFIVAGSFN
ncbi:hypothetical protein Rhal01_02986 [Rubritalea halochordaticola]|uniref:DUF350 domain-containing protein n=1 Tax=Rubritalea halochordaticola TaxID=714537 RepID=A0ABP9V2A8_9BACT